MTPWFLLATVAVACLAQALAFHCPESLSEVPFPLNETLSLTCITHEGLQRCWATYTPQTLANSTDKAPAVMALHSQSGCFIDPVTKLGLLAESERRGFHLVLPQGAYNLDAAMPVDLASKGNVSSWNAGTCCGPAHNYNVDDAGFLTKVVEHIVETLPINTKRFYVYGHSAGAAMAARFAVQHSDKVTAVAAISYYLRAEPIAYTTKVPYFSVHGTNDTTVPFSLSSEDLVASSPGAMADLANFAAINKCTQGPLSQELTVSGDPYTRVSYGGCDAPRDSEVVLVVVPNGTHHPFLPNPGFSTAADNFDSAKIACEFLFDYERDGSVIKRTAWASPSPDYGAAVHGAASVRYITLEQLRSV